VPDPVDALFEQQEGLATVAQLVALGLPADTVRYRLRAGRWRLVLPRVVCRDKRALDARQRLIAACLLAGPDGFISSWSALPLHGIRATPADSGSVSPCPSTDSSAITASSSSGEPAGRTPASSSGPATRWRQHHERSLTRRATSA
jgi:hypothetical protein